MKTIAANLKANLTPQSTLSYLSVLQTELDCLQNVKKHDIIVFPNQTSLTDNAYRHFEIGAQNAYPIHNGAFTGEIGQEVLNALKIKHIMLGHSERRQILGENNSVIKEKFQFFMQENMRIMLCIGEDSNVSYVKDFLELQLQHIDLSYPLLTIAYEPIWAIGSGRTPSFEDIANIMQILKDLGVKKALYGGSVNKDNIAQICSLTDGVLIGGASLCPKNFSQMIALVE
ncbi:triose-phosphate isomerase [Helicobacter trogontum]|uniref:Triosephosphate isomerase n=1 Tax=Helicobacter trogontum TaxID=50960 RepID=A0A4V6HZ95_9HELI|nr:triose-phosphate isomerase family protein [Helicobacter trogontum]TLD83642.1 triosephosphate isomerase [Helicobacter trogontum]